MSFNQETFKLMTAFGAAMIGVLLVICLLAFATPHMAKAVDKLLGRKEKSGTGDAPIPERVEGELQGSTQAEREYKVYDIYEGTPSENNDDENLNKKE